jgi:hypothetical protein
MGLSDLSRPVDSAELIWLMLQAGAVHEICGMKSYAGRRASSGRVFIQFRELKCYRPTFERFELSIRLNM